MAASRIAKRNSSRTATKPLAAVTPPTDWHKVEFNAANGVSNLCRLLTIGSRLPRTRYDPARLGCVMDLDADGKADLLLDLDNLTSGLNRAVAQIGMLMALHDNTTGYVDEDEVVDIGFTINGLASLAEEVMCVRETVGYAEPIGANAGEAAA